MAVQPFELGEYPGTSEEVRVLIAALTEYRKYAPAEDARRARDLFLRLIWCDRMTINFHTKALEIAK